jgi:hypothetical protein
MVKTLNFTTEVPASRELTITLPSDIPIGPAEIVVVVASKASTPSPTLGDLKESEFFGILRDRSDIEDSAEFARRLRTEAWSRTK